jgi:hypothetical protein
MAYRNKEDRNAYQREWYQRNRKKHIQYVRLRKNKHQEWFRALKKSLVCEICGEAHPACLDFHHLPGKKKAGHLSTLVHRGLSKESVVSEMQKCTVLCANCHRKLHWDCGD